MIATFTKSFQGLALTVYRMIAFCVLSSIIIGVLGYISFLLFYLNSSTWASPVVLSPSQEKVISFHTLVSGIETQLGKDKIDLETATATAADSIAQLARMKFLLSRATSALGAEAKQLSANSIQLDSLVADKKNDVRQSAELITNIKAMLKQIDDELAAKLITIDQATQRRVTLQSALNAATDSRALGVQLEVQSQQLKGGANTLSGGASNTAAISSVRQAAELRAMVSQLQIQATTASSTIVMLKVRIAADEQALSTAKNSPYYKSLQGPIAVAFVPYANLSAAVAGQPVFSCFAHVVFCSKVGIISSVFDAEEYARHPMFKTDLRGKFIGVELDDPAAVESKVLFIGSKPLFL
jgi:hypothetical protein